jgi:hypothetical protein
MTNGWTYQDIDNADFFHLMTLFDTKKKTQKNKVVPLGDLVAQLQGGG